MAAFTVIDHTEIGSGGAASWTKSSIPSTYDHLYAVLSPRGDYSGSIVSYRVQLNGETAATNYSYTNFYTQGVGSVSVEHSTSQPTVAAYPRMPAATATANTFGSTTMWIPNYANTANFKQALTMNVAENNSTASWYMYVISGLWSNTDAIDQITITPSSSSNFVQYSTFTLYGITGA